jgi:hypothetical protein
LVVEDCSYGKELWANAHPMSWEELITKQAEMVYASGHLQGVVHRRVNGESNKTLYHTEPVTGKLQVIGLGWLDDWMDTMGPSGEDER